MSDGELRYLSEKRRLILRQPNMMKWKKVQFLPFPLSRLYTFGWHLLINLYSFCKYYCNRCALFSSSFFLIPPLIEKGSVLMASDEVYHSSGLFGLALDRYRRDKNTAVLIAGLKNMASAHLCMDVALNLWFYLDATSINFLSTALTFLEFVCPCRVRIFYWAGRIAPATAAANLSSGKV